LTPIRLRYTGEVIDLTTAYDNKTSRTRNPCTWSAVYPDTVGRVIFNSICPSTCPTSTPSQEKGVQQMVYYAYLRFGLESTVELLDDLKDLGFTYATKSGIHRHR